MKLIQTMNNLRIIVLIAAMVLPALSSWGGSAKRGLGWDEKDVALNADHARLLKAGVAWVYNWGPDAACPQVYDADFAFLPMAWNGAFSESRIRAWYTAHPESRYLLGFNEPNFDDQARMTPARAAEAWPRLEAIAADFQLRLVAPALNFSNSQVGGRIWNPYEWYDEFFRLYPDAKVDCLAMHCYMNWYSAHTWLTLEYFYSDLYNPRKDCYGRYPNLVKFLDTFKATNGHFPKMMLTEFCSWENDGTIKNVEFQIDQMTQKVQMMELSDLVEGYAWFMGNAKGGAAAYPYMSVMQTNTADSGLSMLGEVYVNMSSFDTTKFYAPDELIQAKDYVDATTDERQIKLRPNAEASSSLPLQIEIPSGGYPCYQIDVPAAGTYKFIFHVTSAQGSELTLYVDNKKEDAVTVAPSIDLWTDVAVEAELSAGRHTVMPYNSGSGSVAMNGLRFTDTNGVDNVAGNNLDAGIVEIVTLQGISLGQVSVDTLSPGVYLARRDDGQFRKIIK